MTEEEFALAVTERFNQAPPDWAHIVEHNTTAADPDLRRTIVTTLRWRDRPFIATPADVIAACDRLSTGQRMVTPAEAANIGLALRDRNAEQLNPSDVDKVMQVALFGELVR